MQFMCIDAAWKKEIKLDKKAISFLKSSKISSIALFASVQFLNLDKLKEQLKELDIEIKATRAKRTHKEGQILGCDAYHDSFEKDIIEEADLIIYVGDGLFHPKALLLSQMYNRTIKEVFIWDPVSEKMRIISKGDIVKQIKKLRANIKRYIMAKKIGIIVTIKPGQQYLELAKKLKQSLEKEGKKAYIFIDNTIPIQQLESYPFIESWVNTACPRIGLDDITTISQPLINIREAFNPQEVLEKIYHH